MAVTQDQGLRGKVVDYRVPVEITGSESPQATSCLVIWTALVIPRLRRYSCPHGW
jgi:hypothetical protein